MNFVNNIIIIIEHTSTGAGETYTK